jgi:putative membrane protein
MNRNLFIQFTALVVAAGTALTATAAEKVDTKPGKIGKMDPAEFQAKTEEAGARVAAIMPTADKLSQDDEKYLGLLASAGMRNLEGSKLAVTKAANKDVGFYAQIELKEQMGLHAKLQEIAKAKGMPLPGALDAKSQEALTELQKKSGSDFDRAYLKEFGITGHEMLQAAVGKIKGRGGDKALEELAKILEPIVKTHLDAARAENANID